MLDVAKAEKIWWFNLAKPFALNKRQRVVPQQKHQVALLSFKAKKLVMLVRKNHLDMARVNVIVPKKHVALAVNRNRIKRWVRELFRLRQVTLKGTDLVVICRYSANSLTFSQCEKAFDGLIEAYQELASF